MRALVVEDDALVADTVAAGLRGDGLVCDHVESAEHATLSIDQEHFDLIVLDLGLPQQDGLHWLTQLRARKDGKANVPVLILTARDGLDDRVNGLNGGADDYMTKPFELRELVARGRALMRRANQSRNGVIEFGGIELDAQLHQLQTAAGRAIELTPREWSILEYLLHNTNTVVRKEKLLQALSSWDETLSSNAIEVYISRLRGKLEGAGVSIRTVRGVGYRIEEA
jgi:DNA-binding response OmpR family regulator